jgi:hypothetical protein
MMPQSGGRRPLQEIIAKFREKGATSPDKAMTIDELGLPPRFEQAMHRRLGASGIIVEVSGKYYLDEAKLKQFQDERRAWRGGGMGGGGMPMRSTMLTLRIVRRVVAIAVILLVLTNIVVARSIDVTLLVVGLMVLWVILTVYQLFYMTRIRRSWMGGANPSGVGG